MEDIIKPQYDNREYKTFVLDNGIEVLIISDSSTHKSAVAMTLGVGFYCDPDDYQGLAHFLEHMLFMGTKKYPDPGFFMKYMNKYGGSSNAMTSDESTTYFFDINTKYFDKANDIFSHFFIDPIFAEKTVGREMNAVDSEHSKNISNDLWRLNGLFRHIAGEYGITDKKHPYKRFGTGNLETLKKPGIREALTKFYETYYSANLMKLVIHCEKPLEEIQKLVIKYYSQIKNKQSKPIQIPKYIGKSDSLPLVVKTVPIKDEHTLNIFWTLPNMRKYNMLKPVGYILHHLGHEGKGSVAYALKKEGVIHELFTAIYDEDESMSIINIAIDFPKESFKHVPTVINIIYHYLDILQKEGIEKWRYSELKDMGDINFKFRKKGNSIDEVMDYSLNMLFYPPKYILKGTYEFNSFEKAKPHIEQCLNYLKKDNMVVILSSKEFEGKTDKSEKWYDIKYKVDNIQNNNYGEKFEEMEFNHKKFFLPHLNKFIPKDIKIVDEKTDKYKYPIKLQDSHIEVWFKHDDKFNSPKVLVNAAIYTDMPYKTPKNYIAANIFIMVVEYVLESFGYYAFLANSKFIIYLSNKFFFIQLDAFKDTIQKLLNKIFTTIKQLDITEELFIKSKNRFKSNIENGIYASPYSQSIEHLKNRSYKVFYSNEFLAKHIDSVKLEDVQSVTKWFDGCLVKSLIMGNVTKDEASTLSKYLEKTLCVEHKEFEFKSNWIKNLQPSDEHIYMKKSKNKDEPDSAINIYFEIDNLDFSKEGWDKKMMLLELTYTILVEKFFHELRTVQQSGYIVKSFVQNLGYSDHPTTGISFVVQSSKKSLSELQTNIKKFIEDNKHYVENIKQSDFRKFKKVILSSLKEKFKNINEEYSFYFYEIMMHRYMFDYHTHMMKVVRDISHEDLVEFYNQYLVDRDKRKLRIVEILSIKKN